MYKKGKVKEIFIKNWLFLCFSTGILFENAKRFTEYCIKLLPWWNELQCSQNVLYFAQTLTHAFTHVIAIHVTHRHTELDRWSQ